MVAKLKGSPEFPLTREELLAKYTDCAQPVLSTKDIERAAELILNLKELQDTGGLMAILIGKERASSSAKLSDVSRIFYPSDGLLKLLGVFADYIFTEIV